MYLKQLLFSSYFNERMLYSSNEQLSFFRKSCIYGIVLCDLCTVKKYAAYCWIGDLYKNQHTLMGRISFLFYICPLFSNLMFNSFHTHFTLFVALCVAFDVWLITLHASSLVAGASALLGLKTRAQGLNAGKTECQQDRMRVTSVCLIYMQIARAERKTYRSVAGRIKGNQVLSSMVSCQPRGLWGHLWTWWRIPRDLFLHH